MSIQSAATSIEPATVSSITIVTAAARGVTLVDVRRHALLSDGPTAVRNEHTVSAVLALGKTLLALTPIGGAGAGNELAARRGLSNGKVGNSGGVTSDLALEGDGVGDDLGVWHGHRGCFGLGDGGGQRSNEGKDSGEVHVEVVRGSC